jgi:hypothetical protein
LQVQVLPDAPINKAWHEGLDVAQLGSHAIAKDRKVRFLIALCVLARGIAFQPSGGLRNKAAADSLAKWKGRDDYTGN